METFGKRNITGKPAFHPVQRGESGGGGNSFANFEPKPRLPGVYSEQVCLFPEDFSRNSGGGRHAQLVAFIMQICCMQRNLFPFPGAAVRNFRLWQSKKPNDCQYCSRLCAINKTYCAIKQGLSHKSMIENKMQNLRHVSGAKPFPTSKASECKTLRHFFCLHRRKLMTLNHLRAL